MFYVSRFVKNTAFILTVIAVSFSLSYFALAWNNPGSTPPDGNAAEPINKSSTSQTKGGPLGVTSLFDSDNPTYFVNPSGNISGIAATLNGNVGIGTANPSGLLTVAQSASTPGTVSNSAGGTAITGFGTKFFNTFLEGDSITIAGQTVIIADILTDTSMTAATAIPSAHAGATYTVSFGTANRGLTVQANGSVGVGTTNPRGTLDVNGPLFFAGTNPTYRGRNFPSPIGTESSDLFFIVPTYTGVEDSDLRLYIEDNLTDRFSIWGDSCDGGFGCGGLNGSKILHYFQGNGNAYHAGNLGIGTTNTGADKLDVRGRSYSSGGWQTTDADYAEWFEKEENTFAGDLIGINLDTGKARKYKTGDKFIGIHSANPGVVGNRTLETDEEMGKSSVLVGLLGQLDFDKKQTSIENRIVKTKDGKEIGVLLSSGKVLVGR